MRYKTSTVVINVGMSIAIGIALAKFSPMFITDEHLARRIERYIPVVIATIMATSLIMQSREISKLKARLEETEK